MASGLKRLFGLDWDAIAGILAAVVALVLHLLHVAEPALLLTIVLAILALLLVRDLRRERRDDRLIELAQHTSLAVARLQAGLELPDAVLIGPGRLRSESEAFARQATGEMFYFNVCLLMFKPQALFDKLLRPAIDNPRVTSIMFILDEGERERWTQDVLPKVSACAGAGKVLEPHWRKLRESVSFILAGTQPDEKVEALLSFWGEPFMAHSTGHDVPRYIFRVQGHSELVTRLSELERYYRLGG